MLWREGCPCQMAALFWQGNDPKECSFFADEAMSCVPVRECSPGRCPPVSRLLEPAFLSGDSKPFGAVENDEGAGN